MKVKVEIDMQDFYQSMEEDNIADLLADHVKDSIMRIVKKDPKYRAFINRKATEMLDNIKL